MPRLCEIAHNRRVELGTGVFDFPKNVHDWVIRLKKKKMISVYSYLQERFSFIDKSKTAIWGWSYGGYTAAMALTKDDKNVFKCGLSVAPVTDWIYYGMYSTWYHMYLPILFNSGVLFSCHVLHIILLNCLWWIAFELVCSNVNRRFQTRFTRNVTWACFKTTLVDTRTPVSWHTPRSFVAKSIWSYTARMTTTYITNSPWCSPMNWNEELYFSDNKWVPTTYYTAVVQTSSVPRLCRRVGHCNKLLMCSIRIPMIDHCAVRQTI